MKYGRLHLELDREIHSAYCRMQTPDGTVPSRAIYDIRCHQQKPWRCMHRRTDEAIEAGVKVDAVVAPMVILMDYAKARCARRDGAA